MGPPRKPVASCQALCLQSLEKATEAFVKKATEEISLAENQRLEESIYRVQVYLFHSIPRCLCSPLAKSYLQALINWLKTGSNLSDTELKDSVYIALRLAEVIANDRLETLDLSDVPKQIRSCLYSSLKHMPNLKHLNMGSGHGGWLSDTFCNRFYGGSMETFHHLVALHFHHDCTDHLLRLICENNCQTLKILDVSFSQNVSDSSATSFAICQELLELDVIGSSLSVKAVVYVLSKCRKLRKVNAVKLAQAIEEVDHDQDLQLIECMPETDRCGFVTATTSKHLKNLAAKCSKIQSLSIFSESSYSPLDLNNNRQGLDLDDDHLQFKCLTSLNTWGGSLQTGVLQRLGAQISSLKLVHVENLTLYGNLRQILLDWCPALESLELQNCSIQDPQESVQWQMHGFSNKSSSLLKQLIIISKCSEAFINRLLKLVPTLEMLECGTSTGISDQVLASNLVNLKNLRIFKVAHSRIMTLQSVQLLLENCPALQQISDLTSFPAIHPDELVSIQNHLIQANIDVRIS